MQYSGWHQAKELGYRLRGGVLGEVERGRIGLDVDGGVSLWGEVGQGESDAGRGAGGGGRRGMRSPLRGRGGSTDEEIFRARLALPPVRSVQSLLRGEGEEVRGPLQGVVGYLV